MLGGRSRPLRGKTARVSALSSRPALRHQRFTVPSGTPCEHHVWPREPPGLGKLPTAGCGGPARRTKQQAMGPPPSGPLFSLDPSLAPEDHAASAWGSGPGQPRRRSTTSEGHSRPPGRGRWPGRMKPEENGRAGSTSGRTKDLGDWTQARGKPARVPARATGHTEATPETRAPPGRGRRGREATFSATVVP